MILSDNETSIDRLNNMAIAKTIVSIIKDSKEIGRASCRERV